MPSPPPLLVPADESAYKHAFSPATSLKIKTLQEELKAVKAELLSVSDAYFSVKQVLHKERNEASSNQVSSLLSLQTENDLLKDAARRQLLKDTKLESAILDKISELAQANESLQHKNQEIALSTYNKRFIVEFSEKFSAYKVNNEFFNSLVRYISDLTHFDYVFVGMAEPNKDQTTDIHTIAMTAFGRMRDNIVFPLIGSPCEQVLSGTNYDYPASCNALFPDDKILRRLKVEGFAAWPLLSTDGHPAGLIALMHRKPIEEPKLISSILKIVAKRAEMELERMKYEKNLQQSNEALLRKNEELEKKNDQLQTYAFVSSHDLQEPLRKIQVFTSRIINEEPLLSPKSQDYFGRIQGAAKRMQMFIEDLLTYSRITSVEQLLVKVDLKPILEEVKEELRESIEEKKAIIEHDVLCECVIVPFQFKQLLHNLIGNSLKFSQVQQPPHIIIKASVVKGSELPGNEFSDDVLYCRLTVADNGIGFEEQYKERIFGLFQRLHSKEAYEGTGLGLAIAKRVVENLHGTLSVRIEVDRGTCFTICFPAG